MSDNDTITPETDDELRARLQAFAEEIKASTDTEAALERMPRRSRPPTIRLLAIAACFVLAIAIAAVVMADRQSVDTVPPAQSPTTDCPTPTQPRAITQGAQMNNRFAVPVASAATAIMLLGACDDGPTTLAKGNDIEMVGTTGLADQTLNIDAKEENGEVTGEFRVSDNVISIECADTDTDGIVILGGAATAGPDVAVGDLLALIIREGEPDSVALLANDANAASCTEMLDAIPEEGLRDGPEFVELEDGSNIETG